MIDFETKFDCIFKKWGRKRGIVCRDSNKGLDLDDVLVETFCLLEDLATKTV